MNLCVVGRIISGQHVYLRKFKDTPIRQQFVWTRDRDLARSMTAPVAVDAMRAAREFCDAPTFAVDRRGCIISCGPRILSRDEQKAERQQLRLNAKRYKNVGKTLMIAAEWWRGRVPQNLKERPRRRKIERKRREKEVVADMLTSTMIRLMGLRCRPRKRRVKK